MTRITTTVLIMLLIMNGTATVMEGSGLSEDLGVDIAPGISESMGNAMDSLQSGFSPSAGIGDTLFAMFVAALQVMETVVTAITATPTMLLNFGIPAWIVFPVVTPLYAVSTLELIYVATGRDLV